MATAMTFTSLQEDVRKYLERGSVADADVYAQIPSLINLAERQIASELKVQGFIDVLSFNLVAGQSVYDKPDRWRKTVSMTIGTGATNEQRKTIFARSYEYCRAYWPDATATEEPELYADYDYSHWLVVPTPDASYPAEVLVDRMPALLDDVTQTNWLTDFAPQLLLYRTLLEAAPFLKNDERIAVWQGLYDRAAAMINGEDLAKIFDRAAARKEA